MNGLDAEFERFATICLVGAHPDEIANVRRIFMAGALAQTERILSFLDSNLHPKRKAALLRRVARECEAFKQSAIREARLADG